MPDDIREARVPFPTVFQRVSGRTDIAGFIRTRWKQANRFAAILAAHAFRVTYDFCQ